MLPKQRQHIVWKGGEKRRWSLFEGSQERTKKLKNKENYTWKDIGELRRTYSTKKSAVAHAKNTAENSLAEYEILIYDKKGKLQKTITKDEKSPPPPKWKGENRKKKVKMVKISKLKPNKADLPEGKPYTLEQLFSLGYISGNYKEKQGVKPITAVKKGKKYNIVDGHHRWSYALRSEAKKAQVVLPYKYKIKFSEGVPEGVKQRLISPGTESVEKGIYVAWKGLDYSTVHSVHNFEDRLRKLFKSGDIKSVRKEGRKILPP